MNSLFSVLIVWLVSSSIGLANFAYRLDAAGTRTNLVEYLSTTYRTNSWRFDPLYRLTNETITGTAPTGTIGYTYDAVGNRLTRTSSVPNVATTSANYGTNDWVTGDSYNNNGSTTNSGGNSYAYDFENRLTNFNNGTAVFVYDGDGNRVRKTVAGVTTYYLVDDRNPTGYAQVLEELTTVGATPSRLYTHGLDMISQRQSDGTTSFFGYDGNGNTRFLTSAAGAVTDTYTYEAFGVGIAGTGSTANNYLFAGEQYDSSLGFYYLRARYLNPGMGRFWTRDPFGGRRQEPDTLHKYLYCSDDPINRHDPSGYENTITVSGSFGIFGTLAACRT
ncbi:MAG: RHS repeat-associated core domain-containing protein [Verrucomicrobiota bacterium]